MKLSTLKSCFWFLSLSLMMASADASVIVVDDFDDGTIDLEANSVIRSATLLDQATASAIGGFRDTGVQLVSEFLSARAQANPIPGVIAFSSASASTGVFELIYDGFDFGGLGGVDLTDAGSNKQILVDFTSADHGAELSVELRDTDGNFFIGQIELTEDPGLVGFKLSDFTGVDTTSIDAIAVVVHGDPEGDYVIDAIYAAIPEPSTIMIWSLMAVGMAFYVRRNRAS